MKDLTPAQMEARLFFLHPYKTTLENITAFAVTAFDDEEAAERWDTLKNTLENLGLPYPGVPYADTELQSELAQRQNERDAS